MRLPPAADISGWHARLFLIIALLVASVAETATAQTQPTSKVFRIGIVFFRQSEKSLSPPITWGGAAFLRDNLRDLGWVEGKNLEILWRTAEGHNELIPGIMQELIDKPVDLLALSGNNLILQAMQRTRTIPIVMLGSTMPVESGLVASLARPGGNVTGVMEPPAADLTGKRLEILQQAAPRISRVAFLHDSLSPAGGSGYAAITAAEAAAGKLGLTLLPYPVATAEQLQEAVRSAVEKGANAIFVNASFGAAPREHPALRAMSERYKLPTMYRLENAVGNGVGLMAYGSDGAELYRRACALVDRILRGGNPAEMPVEQVNRYRLVINLKEAKAIGLTIPQSLLAQADEIIQ
jgi:putative tryptophan/tyrosine transport system substrate-binding protein